MTTKVYEDKYGQFVCYAAPLTDPNFLRVATVRKIRYEKSGMSARNLQWRPEPADKFLKTIKIEGWKKIAEIGDLESFF